MGVEVDYFAPNLIFIDRQTSLASLFHKAERATSRKLGGRIILALTLVIRDTVVADIERYDEETWAYLKTACHSAGAARHLLLRAITSDNVMDGRS